MKRAAAALALFLLTAASALGCGGGRSTPEGTVRTYLDALEGGDTTAFRESFTEGTWTLVTEVERLSREATRDPGQALTIDEWCRAFCGGTVEGSTLRGDSATVRVRLDETVDEISLVRVGDEWKIDLAGKLMPAVQMLRLAVSAADTALPADTAAPADTSAGAADTLP